MSRRSSGSYELGFGLFLGHYLGSRGYLHRSSQKRRPAQLMGRILVAEGFFHCHFRHGIHNPLEVLPSDRIDVGIWRGIHEIDGVRYPIFDGELNGVQVIAKGLAQSQGILHDPLVQLRTGWRRVTFDIALVEWRLWVVLHDVNRFLTHDVAAVVLLKFNAVLQGHTQVTSLVVALEKLLR